MADSHANKKANPGMSYQLFDNICLLILLIVHPFVIRQRVTAGRQ